MSLALPAPGAPAVSVAEAIARMAALAFQPKYYDRQVTDDGKVCSIIESESQ